MKKIYKVFLFIFLGISYLVLGKMFDFYIPCPFHFITHLYCPGCGITRMLFSILKGEFYQAFRYNPLLFTFFPGMVVLFIDYIISTFKKKRSILTKIPNSVWYVLIVILIVFGILRNIPYFDYLRPTNIDF